MLIKLLAVVLLSVANCCLCAAQSKNDMQLVQLYDDNDFIAPRGKGTDRSYTNGVKIDVYYTKNATPKFLSRLLIPLNSSSDNLYGIGLTQLMFTPNDISISEIITNDRPYAGVLYFNHSLTSSDNEKKHRLTTKIDLGVIGSNSFAKETQIGLHKLINSPKPMGWGNQVNNAIIINYLIRYEKLLFQSSKKLQIIGILEANAGTLTNNLTAGFIFRAGAFNSYFSNYEKPGISKSSSPATSNKTFQFFFFLRPTVTTVIHNSVLQGGMFSGKSAYQIKAGDLHRVCMQIETGFVLGYKQLGLSFSNKFMTAEFNNDITQQVGNIILYIGI